MGIGKAKQNFYPNEALGYLESLLGLNHPIPRETYFVPVPIKDFFIKIKNQHNKNTFHFFGWIMFILFWYLSHFIIIFYMTTGTFSSTKGIKINIQSFSLSKNVVDILRSGVPITDEYDLSLLSGDSEKLLIIDIPGDTEKIHKLFTKKNEIWQFCKKPSKFRDKFLLFNFLNESEFQHLVDVLDILQIQGLQDDWCNAKVFFASK